MTPPFSPEQVEQAAAKYDKGADRSWWPECPEVFRQEWAETAAMLRAYAEALRQPPKTCATCRFNGPVEHDPFVTCGHPDNVPVGFGPEEAKRFGCTLWEPHKSHA
jgi:hypothetical protein